MSNISNLFENLMTYNDVNKTEKKTNKKPVVENDTTMLNLTVELPTDTEEITPEDVKVDVGVMNVETDEDVEETEDTTAEEDEVTIEDETDDVTPEEETEDASDEDEEDKDDSKEESLQLRKEAIHKKRLEAKQGKSVCTGKDDCQCESCKAKKESSDFETAKKNILKRAAKSEECVDTKPVKNESLMHLDTKSLNKLFTEFVKENYKNIDKVVINKAMLENRMLKLEGVLTNTSGDSTKFSIMNRGFNPAKLENKRFLMDFKDTSNTFGVIKESVKKPFVFTCKLENKVLSFESLDYSFKTMCESKEVNVNGKCSLTENVKPVKESTQVDAFNVLVDKIKAAKNANDLIACKDELEKANIGDTLKAAAQLVWDDMNSRMVAK